MTLALAVSTLALATPARADDTYYVPVSKHWTIAGHGFGHGHGMSQYGAEGAARKGQHYRRILHFYYPHTTLATTGGFIRVLITGDWTSNVIVKARSGLHVQDLSDGAHWKLPGGSRDRWRLTPAKNGSTKVSFRNSKGWHRWHIPDGRGKFTGNGQFYAPGPSTLILPSGRGVTYRGKLRSVRPHHGSNKRDTVNVVGLDNYVKGVVAKEMPASWHQQALRVQAVAARTYGAWLRAHHRHRYYQACDTTACQVYGGVDAEHRSSTNAVKGTAHKILKHSGDPAFSQFSSSSGGWTSAGGKAYLPAKRDPYDGWSGNPVHSWTLGVSARKLEHAHPGIGRLIDLRVTSRAGHGQWGGRVQDIVLDGTRGRAHISGADLRHRYGLRSTWVHIRPTPIIRRWHHIGGASSPIGSPTSGETALANGSQQRFQHGRIYWSHRTHARDLRGPVLRKYRAWGRGGPKSFLDWPRTAVTKAGKHGHGRKAKFQGGQIYWSHSTGARVVFGAIQRRWWRSHAAGGWMGFPVTNVHKVRGGRRCTFQHAIITWHRKTDRTTVKHR
ncbi:MAG: SpoIID/LytB domain-containing protein [Nocardioidaceae bacterium]